MESDFDRAGEDAWLVGLAYDFGQLGLRGWSACFNFAQGTGARDPATGQGLANEHEFDLTIDYRVTKKGGSRDSGSASVGRSSSGMEAPRRRSV